ncbi:MAG: hypothetical protein Q4D77_07380 [Peptostreptococcaceae bacterium]|nr:hypothetical protein [Peptostreptococcaceae bacterium]
MNNTRNEVENGMTVQDLSTFGDEGYREGSFAKEGVACRKNAGQGCQDPQNKDPSGSKDREVTAQGSAHKKSKGKDAIKKRQRTIGPIDTARHDSHQWQEV